MSWPFPFWRVGVFSAMGKTAFGEGESSTDGTKWGWMARKVNVTSH
jgi:hypothetical protein